MLTADEWILIGALVAATSIVWLPPIIGFACWVVAAVQDRRGEAAERSDTQSFDLHSDEAVLLTHEVLDDEETDTVDHFLAWAEEISKDPGIAKHLRRMERRSL